jgi:diacylglycerol kinase (ATP)
VDLLSPDTHPAARIAKDTAAAAVLVCTVVSVAVGILIFGRPIMLLQVFKSIISSPLKLVLLATSLVLSIWFIIKGGYKKAS